MLNAINNEDVMLHHQLIGISYYNICHLCVLLSCDPFIISQYNTHSFQRYNKT